MKNSAVRRPEREAVIKTSRNLVLELDCPSGAAVQCLVNTEISRVSPNRHQVRNPRAESFHVAKLQSFSAWYNAGVPSLAAVSGDGERAVATGRPDHSWIHRRNCDEAVTRPAVLRSECWLMNQRMFLRAQSRTGEPRSQQSYECLF